MTAADGGAEVRLTEVYDTEEDNDSPDWSPDGSRIVYRHHIYGD